MQFHIINGPNLNLVGKRQVDIYGVQTFEDLLDDLHREFPGMFIDYFQSNHEGAIIDELQRIGYESKGIILNPGGLTHTSVSLADTVQAIPSPVVEVHISNINAREHFRKTSYIRPHVAEHIIGKGMKGYAEALKFLCNLNSCSDS
jgi:3-dehydroquinate dehydratase-2